MKITYLVNGLCCIAVILTMPLSLSLYGLSKEALELGAVLVLIHDGCAVFYGRPPSVWPMCWGCQRCEVPHVRIHPVHAPVPHRFQLCAGSGTGHGSRGRVVGHDCGLECPIRLLWMAVCQQEMENLLSCPVILGKIRMYCLLGSAGPVWWKPEGATCFCI